MEKIILDIGEAFSSSIWSNYATYAEMRLERSERVAEAVAGVVIDATEDSDT